MIKITQLLKDSFLTYKLNFNKIFWIALPILILGIIAEYYIAIFSPMIDNNDFSNISFLISGIFIYFISIISVSLFFGPVLNRAIQKKEDGESFNSNSAYAFQKKNIFKWIMVNVWGMLYLVWYLLPYIAVSGLMMAILLIYPISPIISMIISSLIGLILIVGILMNISKFMLYKNIFFSKDNVNAREAVRDSMMFGKTKNNQVWLLILTLIISTIIMMIVYIILGYVVGFISGFIPDSLIYLESVIYAFASSMFFLPWMSIITAKGYVQIRG